MHALLPKWILSAIFFLLLFVSGFWVSRSGKPVDLIKMNIHKFIALGTAVFVGLIIFRIQQGNPWQALEIVAVVVSAVFALAAIVTGGLASLVLPVPTMTIVHKITPYLVLLSTGATLYLFTI